MRIIIDDFMQSSDAPNSLISPSLADRFALPAFTVTLDSVKEFDAIGVGNTDASQITINGDTISLASSEKNGLYFLSAEQNTDTLIISHDGSYIGRLAIGKARFLGAAPTREPGFYTTSVPRVTASGQVVVAAGGVSGRLISLDFRYKVDSEIYGDFAAAYPGQISKGFPFFLLFDKENFRIPMLRMYGATDNELLFQSSVNRFLYSRRFTFNERF